MRTQYQDVEYSHDQYIFIVQDFKVLILAPFLSLHYRLIELLLGLNIGWDSLHNACE